MNGTVARRRRTERLGERAECTPYLLFTVAGETYALPIVSVREIVRLEEVRAVPNTPAALRGMMSYRQGGLAILDVAVAFGWPGLVPTAESCVLVIGSSDGSEMAMGLAVENVSYVLELEPANVVGVAKLAPAINGRFISGMAVHDSGLIPILNLDGVLNLEALREACAAADWEVA